MASIQDKVYLTPLDLAVDRNHSDIAKFLGANGALTMAKIVGIEATRIQALYRSIFFSDICIIVNKVWRDACRGPFNNYVEKILAFFDYLPTSTWTFFTLNVDKKKHFLITYPPHLVHVVFEPPPICPEF